jgi:hypothetical protein
MRWREPDFRGRRMLTKTLLVQCLLEGSLNRSPERARSAESRLEKLREQQVNRAGEGA